MAPDRPASPLLTVKHTIPPVRPAAIARDRLEARLRTAESRLTVVSAPAGWGKTSLLSRWASDPAPGVTVAWVSLDESDDEPVRFWRYVLTALHESAGIGAGALDAVLAPGLDPVDLALPLLLNELANARERHALVLDDYHVLTDSRIHEVVEWLLSYLPPALRLVIAGRADPPLPLARMRARGELTELRAADLRFSVDEATALLAAVSGAAVDDAEAAWRRTEGWAAALQLTGLGLRDGAADLGDRHALDYLNAEVLPSLAPAQRDLLVATAPLERLSGSLCDAVLGTTGSALILDELDRADLFVSRLDAEWYSCHRLLRDALLRETPAGGEVLARAAAWFEQHGRIDDAVRHLLLAGDSGAAAALLRACATWFLERGFAATYVLLGDWLPEDEATSELALSLAYAAAVSRNAARARHWLDVCDRRITPDDVVTGWRDPRSAALVIRGMVTAETDSGTALALAERGMALEEASGARTPSAVAGLGSAYVRDGQFERGVPLLAESWRRRDSGAWSGDLSLQIAGTLGLGLLALERDDELDQLLRQALPLADTAERDWGAAALPMVTLLRLVQGRQAYRSGDAGTARDLLARMVALADTDGRPMRFVVGLTFLADAELACGSRAAAQAALARARDVVDEVRPVKSFAVTWLEAAEQRIGRAAVRSARRAGTLVEPLTDRELSVLRMLPGPASQREIAAALFLSINTVKAYAKSLYRKLGVASRGEAVETARSLGLI